MPTAFILKHNKRQCITASYGSVSYTHLDVYKRQLILLSDIDGLYTCDPHKDPNARLLSRVENITPEILAFGDDKFSELGTGGMRTKLHAALIATQAGSDMVITNGANAESLYDIINGADIGTRFIGRKG